MLVGVRVGELLGLFWNLEGFSGGEPVTRSLLRERMTFPLRSVFEHFTDVAVSPPYSRAEELAELLDREEISELELMLRCSLGIFFLLLFLLRCSAHRKNLNRSFIIRIWI